MTLLPPCNPNPAPLSQTCAPSCFPVWDKPNPWLNCAFPGSHESRDRTYVSLSFQQHPLQIPANAEQGMQWPKAKLVHSHTDTKSKVQIPRSLAFFPAHSLCTRKRKYQYWTAPCPQGNISIGAWGYFSRTQNHQEAQLRHLLFPGWRFICHFFTVNFTPPLISKAGASDLIWHAILMLIFQLFLSYGVNEWVTSITKALWVKPSVHLGGLVAMASVAVGDRRPCLQ